MRIKFTHDFQGKLTNEQFYPEGEEIEIDDEIAQDLIAQHHAVAVEAPKPKSKPRRRSKPAAENEAGDVK